MIAAYATHGSSRSPKSTRRRASLTVDHIADDGHALVPVSGNGLGRLIRTGGVAVEHQHGQPVPMG